jgi:hypothetical protein
VFLHSHASFQTQCSQKHFPTVTEKAIVESASFASSKALHVRFVSPGLHLNHHPYLTLPMTYDDTDSSYLFMPRSSGSYIHYLRLDWTMTWDSYVDFPGRKLQEWYESSLVRDSPTETTGRELYKAIVSRFHSRVCVIGDAQI